MFNLLSKFIIMMIIVVMMIWIIMIIMGFEFIMTGHGQCQDSLT